MKDIKEKVLNKIKKEKVSIKPKSYFRLLKGLLFLASTILLLLAVYVFNLFFYLPRRAVGAPMLLERIGIKEYFSTFPWPLIIVGATIVSLLIFIYRKYEGGYKKHLVISIFVIFFGVLFGGIVLARTNLNEKLEKGPRMKRFYEWNEQRFIPEGPKRKMRERRGIPRGMNDIRSNF